MMQRCTHPGAVELGRTGLRDHHEIDVLGQRIALRPEPLAYTSLDMISRHGIPDLAADREPQTSRGSWLPITEMAQRGHENHEFA